MGPERNKEGGNGSLRSYDNLFIVRSYKAGAGVPDVAILGLS